jgi:hypothetical protein
MGNCPSSTPSTINTCTDTNDLEATDVPIKNFCMTKESSSYNNQYCSYYGGTYPSNNTPTNNTYSYPEPEWVNSNNPNPEGCNFDQFNQPSEIFSPGPCINSVDGNRGYCTRVKNTGDPLICALSDYQCNGANEISNPACFSDKNLSQTCSKDFRAPDTLPSNFLLNQFCLGNILNSIENNGSTGNQVSFIDLWTDNVNPIDGNNWNITGTPAGTKYRTSNDIESQEKCFYDTGGNAYGCPISTWFSGPTGANIPSDTPTQYLPNPNKYPFTGGLPPCQQIFWRTLYGNQPLFKNNFYAPFGTTATCPDGSSICQNTSIPPQQAACGAIPFDGVPTDTGTVNAQFLLENTVKKYISKFGSITGINGEPPNEFQNWVYTVCKNNPNLCGNLLQNTICNNFSQEDLLNDPYKLQWCGCYLSKSSYTDYVDDLGVSQECSPLCNRPEVIPLIDIDTDTPKYCSQSVCIIDDVTITLARTKLESEGLGGGNLNFNQICNSCSTSSGNGTNSNTTTSSNSVNASTTSEGVVNNNATINCQCILKNFTLTTVGATIEGGINISQACNGNAKCYSTGSTNNGSLQEVDCHGSSTSQNDILAKAEAALIKKAKNTSNYWVIFFIILLICLIIVAWLIIAPRGIPEKDTIINKKINLPSPPINSVRSYYPKTVNYFGSFNQPKPKPKFY